MNGLSKFVRINGTNGIEHYINTRFITEFFYVETKNATYIYMHGESEPTIYTGNWTTSIRDAISCDQG